jgi:c-di-GMP-binding flagellar brake protein YcgR
MWKPLESIARRLLENRRLHRRHHKKYTVTIRDNQERAVFRGTVKDISRGGANLDGLPLGHGLAEGQEVLVDFLLLPADQQMQAQWATFPAWVCRVEESPEQFRVAVKFAQPMPD